MWIFLILERRQIKTKLSFTKFHVKKIHFLQILGSNSELSRKRFKVCTKTDARNVLN